MSLNFGRTLCAIAVITSSLTSLCAHAAPQYTLKDTGFLPGGGDSWPYAINDGGQVVGYGGSAEGNRAFVWSGGALTNLGALPGAFSSSAMGINNAGTIVGASASKAVSWNNGVMTVLPGLPSASYSYAIGINQSGQIVGASEGHAVLWDQGQVTSVGTLAPGWVSTARDINDGGLIAGTAYNPFYQGHAMLWNGSTSLELAALPTHTDSGAIALNNAGVVVGYSGLANHDQAVSWTNGLATILAPSAGGVGGRAYDINEAGQIVGFSSSLQSTFSATLWQNGESFNLNNGLVNGEGWMLSQALSINEHGQIAGVGFLRGQSHTFILTPVPEPSTSALIGAGLFSLTLLRRRKSKHSNCSQ